MASATGRVFQTVKKHIPSIRFPNRTKQKMEPGSSHRPPEISSVLSAITRKASPTESVTRLTSSNSSASDDSFDYQSLPIRYRRRLLTQEEIDYIERGGPE
ncbi:28S ribosomal protein S36, mitochondrial-like [Stylophora pistillata]|uniref:28S ribosomal protein S36, mitochondrial n=1 Tax=Stylophora pistillata TaxID=50429 RepID=A0A2B4S0V8_STYPI|nr:28S ribosomal protein S36, mitochondrial-like [Stylophora pistillata]PFX22683.1 28S ribosomal protein S36, mitochondrial [Stylophora pistillata]